MQKKKGISLIVLVITIIVMIILASAVVLTLSNTGIINKADEAVNQTELKEVQHLATLAWADAYKDASTTQEELEKFVIDTLKDNKVDVNKYTITVTTEGVKVEKLLPVNAGIYQSGTNYGTKLVSWEELISSGSIVVNNGTVSVGTYIPENLPAKNSYGFYYDVVYNGALMGMPMGMLFRENGAVEIHSNGEVGSTMPEGTAVYSIGKIDMSSADIGVATISPDGLSVTFSDLNSSFALAEPMQLPAGDLLLPANGSVTSIGEIAFADQTGLTGVIVPNNVTLIGCGAFIGCTSLESMSIPFVGANAEGTITTILGLKATFLDYIFGSPAGGDSGINVPDSLKSVTVTGGTFIDNRAFYNLEHIENIRITDGVTTIVEEAFLWSGVVNISLPDSVESIGQDAFENCDNLKTVTFGNNSRLKTIGASAFSDCDALTSIKIPDGVTTIDRYAFSYCENLSNVDFSENSKLDFIGEGAFIECRNLTSIYIPNTVTTIDIKAFRNCSNLANVTFEENTQLTAISDWLFYDCGMTSITLPEGITSIGQNSFRACVNLKNIDIPDSVTIIDEYAFMSCTGLTNIELPNTNINIKTGAFDYSGLTSIVIPNKYTTIGYFWFADCVNLKTVTIPTSVTSIAKWAFMDCTGLTTIIYEGTMAQWNAISKYNSNNYEWNHGCGEITVKCTDGDVIIPADS